jgi:hypothetical protein
VLTARVSFSRETTDVHENRCVSFRQDRGDEGSQYASLMLSSQYRALFWCPLLKFLVGPKKQPFRMTGE